jgi:predicted FMN-binding regulatory protein PaiB
LIHRCVERLPGGTWIALLLHGGSPCFQNRPPEDRAGVVAGLSRGDGPMHHVMAKLVRERG